MLVQLTSIYGFETIEGGRERTFFCPRVLLVCVSQLTSRLLRTILDGQATVGIALTGDFAKMQSLWPDGLETHVADMNKYFGDEEGIQSSVRQAFSCHVPKFLGLVWKVNLADAVVSWDLRDSPTTRPRYTPYEFLLFYDGQRVYPLWQAIDYCVVDTAAPLFLAVYVAAGGRIGNPNFLAEVEEFCSAANSMEILRNFVVRSGAHSVLYSRTCPVPFTGRRVCVSGRM